VVVEGALEDVVGTVVAVAGRVLDGIDRFAWGLAAGEPHDANRIRPPATVTMASRLPVRRRGTEDASGTPPA